MIEFEYPQILFLYLPFFILVVFNIIKSTKYQIFADTPLDIKNVLFENINSKKVKLKQNLIYLSTVFLIFAASGPQIGTALAPVDRKGLDLVFCIDVSSSMRGTDIKPSRLEKSKFEISQLIKNLKGDRVAFIVFAGSSHLYLPLTTDYEAALLFLNEIDSKMIPTQGTVLSKAMLKALESFSNEIDKFKVMLLISDGEDHDDQAVNIASKASDAGFIINTVGVGSKNGSLIPIINDKDQKAVYKRDAKGNLITSIPNEKVLKEIATAGKGTYFRFANSADSYREIAAAIENMEKKTISTHEFSEYEDRYQIIALASLLCYFIGFVIPTKEKSKS